MPINYPTELKVKTIRRYEKGESIKALSEELHISQSTLYQWRRVEMMFRRMGRSGWQMQKSRALSDIRTAPS